MRVLIKENYEEMSKYAAEIISDSIKEKPNLVLGLATGSTPERLYKELIQMHKKGLDFSRASSFNLDEYFGIGIDFSKDAETDQSYARFMHEKLFKHINVRPENTFVPNGMIDLEKLQEYCDWYEKKIREKGGIDIQILGTGLNGHIGFNEPGSSFYSRTRLEPLDKSTIDANWEKYYKNTGGKKEEMPHFAITVGIGTIFEAKHLILMANGRKKSEVVARAIEGPIMSQVPASFLQFHSNLTVLLDEESASCLKRHEHYIYVEKMEKMLVS